MCACHSCRAWPRDAMLGRHRVWKEKQQFSNPIFAHESAIRKNIKNILNTPFLPLVSWATKLLNSHSNTKPHCFMSTIEYTLVLTQRSHIWTIYGDLSFRPGYSLSCETIILNLNRSKYVKIDLNGGMTRSKYLQIPSNPEKVCFFPIFF